MRWINVHVLRHAGRDQDRLLSYLPAAGETLLHRHSLGLGHHRDGPAAGASAGWRLGAMAAVMTALIAMRGSLGQGDDHRLSLRCLGPDRLGHRRAVGHLGGAERARAQPWVGSFIDTLQTLPSFVYLIPVVMLFRVGRFLGDDRGRALRAGPSRALCRAWRALGRSADDRGRAGRGLHAAPAAVAHQAAAGRASLLLGLNQTIMLALSMLVITALVGTRDLGQEVYIALTKANSGPRHRRRSGGRLHRHHRGPHPLGHGAPHRRKGWD